MNDLPKLPWYDSIERVLAPTERASTYALLAVIAITAVIAWKGNATIKAAWLVYIVSP
jgi:hypothetical protein